MSPSSTSRNKVLASLFGLETAVGLLLSVGAITYAADRRIAVVFIAAFLTVQLTGILVWFKRVSVTGGIHTVQAIVRLFFYAYTFYIVGAALAGVWLASFIVAALATLLLAYLTDYVWYECTIAP